MVMQKNALTSLPQKSNRQYGVPGEFHHHPNPNANPKPNRNSNPSTLGCDWVVKFSGSARQCCFLSQDIFFQTLNENSSSIFRAHSANKNQTTNKPWQEYYLRDGGKSGVEKTYRAIMVTQNIMCVVHTFIPGIILLL